MYLIPKDDSFPCYEGVGRASRGVAPELDEVSKRLLAAAEIIRERGWHRGSCEGRDGNVCVGMAISYACGDMGFIDSDDAKAAWNRLSLHVFGNVERHDGLINWNDERGRTAQDVLAALESAALHPTVGRAYP